MNASLLPSPGSYVEMTAGDETLSGVRVVRIDGRMLTLSVALADVPRAGTPVTLHWATPRGRLAVTADVTVTDENRFDLLLDGEPSVVQDRHFVRGGGGELIVMERDGEDDARGRVHDLSERAVRAHFTDVTVHPGDPMTLRIQLVDEVVEFPAHAFTVVSMRQQVPRRGPLSVEMIAVFDGDDDHSATLVRRHIIRQQLRSRARTAAP